MNFKTVIDKIVDGGKLILAQPTFIFKDKEEVPFNEAAGKPFTTGNSRNNEINRPKSTE